ncbi:MAG: EF-hand domain-containing protein [Aliarcobacter sp.]|nr:EF-hand domain-containing protein [Aliarcobacter sp.]
MKNIVKIFKLSLVVIGSLSALTSAVVAQELPNNQSNRGMGQGFNMPNFEDFDLNKDGMINAKEMDEAREKRMAEKSSEGRMMKNVGNQPTFSEIDTNKDGNINKEEFLAHQIKQRQ